MKRLFPLIISLVIPLGMAAQRQTDKTVMDIANYLNEYCLESTVTDAVCGRNRTIYAQYKVDNRPIHATRTLLDSIAPLINRLPHKHRMTDEQADEIFKGRIAMRLHPERGDTSAYFLMDYSRGEISFKYGVNSPKSINIINEHSLEMNKDFNYRDLPADSVAGISNLLCQMEQRAGAIVLDTMFTYVRGRRHDWWLGAKGEASRTPAHVLLLQGVKLSDFQKWNEVFAPLAISGNATIYKTSNFQQGLVAQLYSTISFCTGGAFCLYHAVYYQECLCVVRVIVPTWKQCNTVPDTKELIDNLRGKAQPATQRMKDISPEFEHELVSLQSSMRQNRSDAQVIDTLFVSNDQEGHVWWMGLDGRCPTTAQLVLVQSSLDEYQNLSSRLMALSKVESGSNKTSQSYQTVFRWMDKNDHLHIFLLYYYFNEQKLLLARADGLDPYCICVPHPQLSLFSNNNNKLQSK